VGASRSIAYSVSGRLRARFAAAAMGETARCSSSSAAAAIRVSVAPTCAPTELGCPCRPERPALPQAMFATQGRLKGSMRGANVVVHASALNRIEVAVQNPIELVRTNVDGFINMIEASQDARVEKVVALSIGSVAPQMKAAA
jgi:nucleoside-diphosphate-sugar epimerase